MSEEKYYLWEAGQKKTPIFEGKKLDIIPGTINVIKDADGKINYYTAERSYKDIILYKFSPLEKENYWESEDNAECPVCSKKFVDYGSNDSIFCKGCGSKYRTTLETKFFYHNTLIKDPIYNEIKLDPFPDYVLNYINDSVINNSWNLYDMFSDEFSEVNSEEDNRAISWMQSNPEEFAERAMKIIERNKRVK